MKFTATNRHDILSFVKGINPEYKVSFQDIFEADIYEEQVFVGSQDYAKSYDCEMFIDWFNKEFNCCINPWLIALLHEIGHLETTTEELQEERDDLYSLMVLQHELGVTTIEELNKAYFQIPCELEATTWGYWYYKHNKEICDNLLKALDLF